MATPGVVGTAVGLTADGRPVVRIFTETARVGGLPASLDGVPVEVEVTGKFIDLKLPKDPPGRSHGKRVHRLPTFGIVLCPLVFRLATHMMLVPELLLVG